MFSEPSTGSHTTIVPTRISSLEKSSNETVGFISFIFFNFIGNSEPPQAGRGGVSNQNIFAGRENVAVSRLGSICGVVGRCRKAYILVRAYERTILHLFLTDPALICLCL